MRRRGNRRPSVGHGFTLVELMVVVIIIGILITFIVAAAMDGIRRSEERATQALIAKLESGMADRLETLVNQRADVNAAHSYLAAVWPTNSTPLAQFVRAQTIAQVEFMKAEVPDVFVVQGAPNGVSNFQYYPLNFAAGAYAPATTVVPVLQGTPVQPHGPYMLPLGVAYPDDYPNTNSFGATSTATVPTFTGAYGASWTAAAGLYKQLAEIAAADGGSNPTPANAGYDGVDNNGNGLVDELSENGTTLPPLMLARLARHTHKTARAEMLYALLVEGQGPLGSVFSRDEFRDTEVRDTDGDGLLEFVDAWGEPLQFYRWPFFYESDVQKGARTYNSAFEPRQQNPLDPNQQLLAPAWWSGANNANSSWPAAPSVAPLSGGAFTFQRLFFTLTDPNTDPGIAAPAGFAWDRGSSGSQYFYRRAYYSRFLVLSGGPDKAPGVPVLDADYWTRITDYVSAVGQSALVTASSQSVPTGGFPGPLGANQLAILQAENQAFPGTPYRRNTTFYSWDPSPGSVDTAVGLGIREAGNDDITNHNLQAAGGATQ